MCAQALTGELLPVFSQSKMNDCFADIMVPSWTNYGAVDDGEGAVPWEARAPSLFFRGSSTGGFVGDATPFASMHRQRLVALAANQSRMDVAFVEFVQCSPAACAAMEARCGHAMCRLKAGNYSILYLTHAQDAGSRFGNGTVL